MKEKAREDTKKLERIEEIDRRRLKATNGTIDAERLRIRRASTEGKVFDAEAAPQKPYRIRLIVPIREACILDFGKPIPMRLRSKRRVSAKTYFLPTLMESVFEKIIPKLPIVRVAAENIRVEVIDAQSPEVLGICKPRIRIIGVENVSVELIDAGNVTIFSNPLAVQIRQLQLPKFVKPPVVAPKSLEATGLCTPMMHLTVIFEAERSQELPSRTAEVEEGEIIDTEAVEISPTAEASSYVEFYDPFDLLFPDADRRRNIRGTVTEVEPLVIIFKDAPNDSFIQTFETLLLRLYREKYGGLQR